MSELIGLVVDCDLVKTKTATVTFPRGQKMFTINLYNLNLPPLNYNYKFKKSFFDKKSNSYE